MYNLYYISSFILFLRLLNLGLWIILMFKRFQLYGGYPIPFDVITGKPHCLSVSYPVKNVSFISVESKIDFQIGFKLWRNYRITRFIKKFFCKITKKKSINFRRKFSFRYRHHGNHVQMLILQIHNIFCQQVVTCYWC